MQFVFSSPLDCVLGGFPLHFLFGCKRRELGLSGVKFFKSLPTIHLLQSKHNCKTPLQSHFPFQLSVVSGIVSHFHTFPVGQSTFLLTRVPERACGCGVQAAMVEVPALLDPRLGTTRELERFRNHLAIAGALRQNYGRVRDIYEDRCAPYCSGLRSVGVVPSETPQ